MIHRSNATLRSRLVKSFLFLGLVQVVLILIVPHALGLYRTEYDRVWRTLDYSLQDRSSAVEDVLRTTGEDLLLFVEDHGPYMQELMRMTPGDPAAPVPEPASGLEEVAGVFILLGDAPVRDGEDAPPGVYLRRNPEAEDGWYLEADDLISDAAAVRDLFNVPVAQALETGYAGYYISRPFRPAEEDREVIVIAAPMMDANGMPHGVLGLELDSGLLTGGPEETALPGMEDSFYLLAPDDSQPFSGMLFSSSPKDASALTAEGLTITTVKEYPGIYRYKSPTRSGSLIGSTRPLEVYDSDSPYAGQMWHLYSFTDEAVLMQGIRSIRNVVAVCILSFLAINAVAAWYVSRRVTGPVVRLARDVSRMGDNRELTLEPTNIAEIDAMLETLVSFRHRMEHSSTRLSSIINLMGRPIGGFEENFVDDIVYITDSVSYILGTDFPNPGEVSMKDWFKVTECLSRDGLEDYEDIYRYVPKDEQPRYVQLTTRMESDRRIGIMVDVTDEITDKQQLQYERDTDALTRLLNRRGFPRHVVRRIREQPGRKGAMIFIDLDNLKSINDTFGHKYGDRYISTMASLISTIPEENGYTARLSGDEFAIYIHGYETMDEIRDIFLPLFERIRKTDIILPGEVRKLSFCAGIAWYPQDASEYTLLLKYADYAMYQSKHGDKNSYREFNQEQYQMSQ